MSKVNHFVEQFIQPLKSFTNRNPSAYTKGLAPYREKNWNLALNYFTQATKDQPQHAPSHFKLGMCYFRQKSYLEASECMARALELAPNQTQWTDQFKQVQRHLANTQNDDTDKISINKETHVYIAAMQVAALKGDYQKADELYNLVEEILGASPAHQSSMKKIRRFACEVALMSGDDQAFKIAVEKLEDNHFSRNLYMGIEHYYKGMPKEALKELQLISKITSMPDSGYWLARTFNTLGDKESAWQVLENLVTTSRRAATWQQLANLVDSPSLLQRYLLLLERWCIKAPSARHHRDVANATAKAALAGDNAKLAKKTLHDSIAYHFNRKDGPSSVLPTEVEYFQEQGIPIWNTPFASLPNDIIKNSYSERALQSLTDMMSIADRISIMPIAVQKTLQLILKPSTPLVLPQLKFVLQNESEESLIKALAENRGFVIDSADENSVQAIHANGISISILILNKKNKNYEYEENGIIFQHDKLTTKKHGYKGVDVYIPDDLTSYFRESGVLQSEIAEDWLLKASNKKVANLGKYLTYAYSRWLYSLINNISDLEGLAVRTLREHKEHEKSYQSLIKNYTIPDADMIRQDGIKVVLYVSGLEKVGYQANMWIPVLERLSQPAAIVIREKGIADELISTSLPVYFLKTMRDVECLEIAGVDVILYPANTQKNIHTLRFHRMKHYFINHGESDKVVNQSKFLMAYDKLLVAGPMAERRLREAKLPLRDNQIIHVGRPQAELLLDKIKQPGNEIKTILYAPTWEGFVEEANYSSVSSFGYNMLQCLTRYKDINILFKPHPYTGYNKNGDCAYYLDLIVKLVNESENMTLIPDGDPIHSYMNQSDILVTDISSVLNDYLYTLKPIVLANIRKNDKKHLIENFPSTEAAYILNEGLEIGSLIDQIKADDNYYETRLNVCSESLGSFSEGPMSRFNRVVCDLTMSNNMELR